MVRQLSFLSSKKEYGGTVSVGKRKERRPVVTKRPMHLVLKSSKAVGVTSLHGRSRFIEALYKRLAKKHLIKVFEFSNNGNHLHFVIQAKTREGFKRFVTAFSGCVAQRMTQSWKGKPSEGKFWDCIPFTRILEWGRDLRNTLDYVVQNYLEERRMISYQVRGRKKRVGLAI